MGHGNVVWLPSSTKDPPEVCGHKFKVGTFPSHAELHTCRYDETREGKRVNVYARGVYKNGTSRLSWLRRGLWESEEKGRIHGTWVPMEPKNDWSWGTSRRLESGLPVGRILWGLPLLALCDLGRLETRLLQERCSRSREENVLEELYIYMDIEITKNYDRTHVQEHI